MQNRLALTWVIPLLAMTTMLSAEVQPVFQELEAPALFFNPEAMIEPFVLEAKQIFIPEHPDAFNGSVIRYHDRLLMSFRELNTSFPIEEEELEEGENSGGYSNIGLVWLNDQFELISTPQLLAVGVRIEDPRLVLRDDEVHLIFADSYDDGSEDVILYRRMYDATVTLENDEFFLCEPRLVSNFGGKTPDRHEKNWVPFDCYENLLFAYSINPHLILQSTKEGCRTLANTHFNFAWAWGEPRGGTPALAINEDHYLGFFHSSKVLESTESEGEPMMHYFMGAYLFNRKAPFAITHVSSNPIVGPDFYVEPRYIPYWEDVRVVFPCGFIEDEAYIWLMFGRQDHEIWVTKIDRAGLLDSLVAVNSSQFDQSASLIPVHALPEEAWAFELKLASEESQAMEQEIHHLKEILPQLQARVLHALNEKAVASQAIDEANQTYWGSWVHTLDDGNFLYQIVGDIVDFISTDYQQARIEHRELGLNLEEASQNLAQQTHEYEQYQHKLAATEPLFNQLLDRATELSRLISSSQESQANEPAATQPIDVATETSHSTSSSQELQANAPAATQPIDVATETSHSTSSSQERQASDESTALDLADDSFETTTDSNVNSTLSA